MSSNYLLPQSHGKSGKEVGHYNQTDTNSNSSSECVMRSLILIAHLESGLVNCTYNIILCFKAHMVCKTQVKKRTKNNPSMRHSWICASLGLPGPPIQTNGRVPGHWKLLLLKKKVPEMWHPKLPPVLHMHGDIHLHICVSLHHTHKHTYNRYAKICF